MVLYFAGFIFLVFILLALDLGVFHRKEAMPTTREAIGWTVVWVILALLFNGLVYFFYEHHWLGIGTQAGQAPDGLSAAIDFLTAYLIEKSLSIDNIFVIAMVFSYFRVPSMYQHRVLFWGIFGALIMRGIMIFLGIAAIREFSFFTYILGALLIVTAIKMMGAEEHNLEPEKNPLIRLLERFFPVTKQYHGNHFFVKLGKKWAVTPLCLALVVIESMDLLFAVDSIPAVLAITLDPFLVFTSNVFAILGLRSLYFALANMMSKFRYVKMSLIFVLVFIGTKMLLAHYYPISAVASLAVVFSILTVGVIASLVFVAPAIKLDKAVITQEVDRLSKVTVRTVRKIFFFSAGVTLILVGIMLLVLPGPGVLVIFLGFALLAAEFVWARIWMSRVKNKMQGIQKTAKHLIKRPPKS